MRTSYFSFRVLKFHQGSSLGQHSLSQDFSILAENLKPRQEPKVSINYVVKSVSCVVHYGGYKNSFGRHFSTGDLKTKIPCDPGK